MRKVIVLSICSVLLLTGCGTYTGTGAYVGGQFGSVLGSAIGGITGGARGSDVGTIIGMAGGAVIGAAIGNAKDEADRRDVHDHYERVQRSKAASNSSYDNYGNYGNYDSGYDPSNSGDDRLYDFDGNDYTGNYSAANVRCLLLLQVSSICLPITMSTISCRFAMLVLSMIIATMPSTLGRLAR